MSVTAVAVQSAKMELQTAAAAATLTAVKKQNPTKPAKPVGAPVKASITAAASNETKEEEEMETEPEAEGSGLAALSEAADTEKDTGKCSYFSL